jgi:hypothetical protein
VEVLFIYGIFIGFLVWLGFQWFRGEDGRAGMLYAVIVFIAAVVVAGRYWGRAAAGYSNSPEGSIWVALWFLCNAVLASLFASRANQFRRQMESNETRQMLESAREREGRP